MDTSNIVALVLGGIGFIISIIGLIVTPKLNLKSKQLEERLKYRFILFEKILELQQFTQKNSISNQADFNSLMQEVNKLTQLYGYTDETKSFQKVIKSYKELAKEINEVKKEDREDRVNNAVVNFESTFNKFLSLLITAYRKELVLGKLELDDE